MIKMFTEQAWQDYLYWQQHDKAVLRRVNKLIKNIEQNPYEGIGKPEELKYALSGCWSRRITQEHRLIYAIIAEQKKEKQLLILSARTHYQH